MTLVLAYGLPDIGKPFTCYAGYVASDSIVTSNMPIQDFNITSQGQAIHPITVNTGYGKVDVKYFAEAACKIGVLNKSCLIAASGDLGIIEDVLPIIYRYEDEIKSIDSLPRLGENACISLNPYSQTVGKSATILFLIYNNSLCTISALDFIVEPAGLRWRGQWNWATEQQPSQWRGCGTELLAGHPLSFHVQSELRHNPDMLHYAIQLELSEAIKKIGHDSACHGVGGSFFTIGVTNDGPAYPLDYIYISADHKNRISVLTKMTYREGHFYVMDFLNNTCRVMQTLETLQKYQAGIDTASYINDSYISNATSFRGQIVVINIKTPDGKSTIDIQGSESHPAVTQGESLHNKQLKGGRLHLELYDGDGKKKKSFDFTINS